MLFAAFWCMGTSGNPFFSWLAAQPAFIEVGLGIAFCLIIGPVLLAFVAVALTMLEGKLARILSQSGLLAPTSVQQPTLQNRWAPLRRALQQELPWLRKAAPKRHA
jgi:hypothetical protein